MVFHYNHKDNKFNDINVIARELFLISLCIMAKHSKNQKLLNAIAAVIKELRELENKSQDEVNDEFKLEMGNNISVGRIETAKNNSTVSTIYDMCIYFKISLSDLIRKIEEKDPSLKIDTKDLFLLPKKRSDK